MSDRAADRHGNRYVLIPPGPAQRRRARRRRVRRVRTWCIILAGGALFASPWWFPDGIRDRMSETISHLVAGIANPATANEAPATDPS